MQNLRNRTGINILKTALLLSTAAAALLLFGRVIADLTGILFAAAVFSFLLAPVARLLEKKLNRRLAALFCVLGAILLLFAAVALLLPPFVRQFSALAELIPDALERLRRLGERITVSLQRRLPEMTLPRLNLAGTEGELSSLARSTMRKLSSAANGLYRLFLSAVLSYFFLADRERILLRMELLVPSAWRTLAIRGGKTLLRELRLFLRGQATIALAVGALSAAALALIGVSGAPLLGLLVGAFNVIPYFGPLLGGIPVVMTALSASWRKAMMSVLALFLVQQIDGMVISPRIMGNITGFSPAVVLIALFVGAQTSGVLGMLFALPVLMSFRTLYRVFVQRHENN